VSGDVTADDDRKIRTAVAELRAEAERLVARLDAMTARVERLEAEAGR
jgi:uncharacterized coiled-coil protein SlyX